MLKLAELERVQDESGLGTYRLTLPITEVREWAIGDIVLAKARRGRTTYPLRVVAWYATEPGEGGGGADEEAWVYWFDRVYRGGGRYLTPAARPAGSVLGYVEQPYLAMPGEPEAVSDEWQATITASAWRSREQQRAEEQVRRQHQPFAMRLAAVKQRARAVRVSGVVRAEVRTIEILGAGDRSRATAMLGKLERRLFR